MPRWIHYGENLTESAAQQLMAYIVCVRDFIDLTVEEEEEAEEEVEEEVEEEGKRCSDK